jgi:hypothetical protein
MLSSVCAWAQLYRTFDRLGAERLALILISYLPRCIHRAALALDRDLRARISPSNTL